MNLEPSPSVSNSHDFAMNTSNKDVQACLKVVHDALVDVKAKDILQLDVSSISNVADAIVIASGTSTRHVKALADNVAEEARKAGFRPIGVEGERDAEWILIDLGFVVVHVMLPTARKFYDLESLWRTAPESVLKILLLKKAALLSRFFNIIWLLAFLNFHILAGIYVRDLKHFPYSEIRSNIFFYRLFSIKGNSIGI